MGTNAGVSGFRQASGRQARLMGGVVKVIVATLLVITATPAHAQTVDGATSSGLPTGGYLPSPPAQPPAVFRGMQDCVENGGRFECVPALLTPWKYYAMNFDSSQKGQQGFNTLDEITAWLQNYLQSMNGVCKITVAPIVMNGNEMVGGGAVFMTFTPTNPPGCGTGPAMFYAGFITRNRVYACPSAAPPYTYIVDTTMCERPAQNACPAHASGTPCACDAGYVFNSTKTACVTLQLSITPSVTYIPIESRVQNKRVLTQSDLALNVRKGSEPASGIAVNLQSSRTAGVGAGQDTINGPAKPTDAKGNATADISTRDQPGTAVIMASNTANMQTISPGIVHWLPADYQSGFSISCYTLSQESEFSAKRTTSNACGLPGTTYRSGFLDDVRVQGSGIGLNGKIIRYHGKKQGKFCYEFDTCPHTASGKCAVVGTTIAVDPTIIPLGDSKHPGSYVNIDIKGQRYAQDTGGDIKKYKIDDYVGLTKTRHECMVIGRHQSKVTFLNY